MDHYDVAVIGAGHAGCEAALAAARLGCRTLLLTLNLDNIAFMPCNPSIGGPAKGHLVREIDALGGEMGKNIDRSYLQMRMLNTGKGPAVQALRAQADKHLYHINMRKALDAIENLRTLQGEACEIHTENGRIAGIKIRSGISFRTGAVVLAAGTFLRGRIYQGELRYDSGPQGFAPASLLPPYLECLGFRLKRLKTGTPPRIHANSVDYRRLILQEGDQRTGGFSYYQEFPVFAAQPCWLTYTTEKTHAVIRENMHRAALFSGAITGIGPRYCPSIEGKLVQFPDRTRHQVFIEPEGRNSAEIYLAGLSTSLPEDVQWEMVRSIPGLENAWILRAGYAIEYDALESTQLDFTLMAKHLPGFFSAGQVNGTSGYEEAAAQGLIAGINAASYVKGKEPLKIRRDEGYLGVMIDDLVTKGVDEPYRMLTSRSEFRLLLRHDNADFRLSEKGHRWGLLPDRDYKSFIDKGKRIERELARWERTSLSLPPDAGADDEPLRNLSIEAALKRGTHTYRDLGKYDPCPSLLNEADLLEAEQRIKYAGYLKKQQDLAARLRKMEERGIPEDFDYTVCTNLAREAREKLACVKPATLGQAARIPGVNPNDLNMLLLYLARRKGEKGGDPCRDG
ncbi:MAG: tRNA uridine-5-carboxymethylaminomethyl(34) synthesis enzyme MnmG [Bacillota bacterium]